MIERVRKIRRDPPKDYQALVDFPVEIVGRDGGVRRYSFEESVRLYQRRGATAGARLSSPDAAAAEAAHCRSRIAQLRRSYLLRYGWSAARAADSPGLLAGDFAGEIAAFLRRSTGQIEVEADEIEIALVAEDELHDVYFARVRGADETASGGPAVPWTVYVFRFRERGSCLTREGFFKQIKHFQAVSGDEQGGERMLAFHHTVDCGIILTSTERPTEAAPLAWLDLGGATDDSLRAGIAAMRQGQSEEALRCFVATYEAEHFRRSAYVGALVMADHIGAFDQAYATAAMASAYFPDDLVILWHRGLTCLRTGEPARAAVDRLRCVAGDRPAVLLLAALEALYRGRTGEGRALLRAARPQLEHAEPDLHLVAERLSAVLLQRDVILGAGTAIGLTGLALGLLLGPWMLLLTVMGASTVLLARTHLLHRVGRWLADPGARGMRLANPSGLRGPAVPKA